MSRTSDHQEHGYYGCSCDACEGEYFAVQHRPDDVCFDGDERERYYQPRQNRHHEGDIIARRPRS